MIKKIIFICIFISSTVFAEDWTKTFSEDSENQYWIGLSSPKPSEKEALNEAYNEALNEASKYNFGFTQESQENFYANKNDSQYNSQSNIIYKNVQFNEIKPISQQVKIINGNFIAYRKISYSKKAISTEKRRLSSIQKPIEKNHNPTTKENNLGSILIKNEQEILINLLSEKGTSYIIKSNETFYLPIGLYRLFVKQNGFSFIEKEVIITGQPLIDSIILEKNQSFIFFDVYPKDAKITINNVHLVSSKSIKLDNGSYDVLIEHENFSSQIIKIELASDSTISAKLLQKKSSISIITNPSDADVFVNGSFIGKSPILGYSANAYENTTVSLSKTNYKFLVENIKINAKGINSFKFNLEKVK